LMMSLWDALRMNMMISYQELVRTFLKAILYFKLSTRVASYPDVNGRCSCYCRLLLWEVGCSRVKC
ncbi:MAG: hypothetical protein DI539_29025, partial [Flavobacterium psychrophilum]